MTTDEKPEKGTKCCVRVHSGGYVRGHQCGKAAKVIRDGKPYCGIHDPVAVRARKDKRNAEWKERWDAEAAARAQAEAARAERDRRAACFDDLLAALVSMVGLVRLKYGNLDADIWGEVVKAEEAIAKAKGEPS